VGWIWVGYSVGGFGERVVIGGISDWDNCGRVERGMVRVSEGDRGDCG
jgi:hypothetical protein